MLTTAASRFSPSARALQSRPPSVAVALPLLSVATQQCRSFRGGPWASPSESETQPGARKRHRMLRYKNMEAISGSFSWEKQPRKDNKAALKKAMAESINSATGKSSKYVNVDEIKSWSDDVSGLRPDRGIEDVERDAMEHLLRGNSSGPSVLTTQLHDIGNYVNSHRAPKEVTPDEVLRATAPAEATDSFIDPITNRRVLRSFTPKYEDLDQYGPVKDTKPKTQPTTESLVQDAQKYQSVKWNEPNGLPKRTAEENSKEYKDLGKYSPVKFDNPDKVRELTPEEESKNYKDLDQYEPVAWNEPDGMPKTTSEEDSKNYTDLHKYSAVQIDNPHAPRALTPEEASKQYGDLHLYGAVRWNEPNGLQKVTAEEASKNYDDLSQYGPIQWNEPDGLQRRTPEELSKNYQDLLSYEPVAWSEPDGLRQLTPEEKSKQYQDLDKYAGPFVVKDSVLQAHEAAQMDPTPKAEPLAAKVNAPIEDKSKEYKDLSKYGPVRWNEPDGLRKLTPEELSKSYEDLHLYSAARWNEPDGLRPLTSEEKSKKYQDLRAYAPADKSGPEILPGRVHPEEASKRYEDLPEYSQYDNGDATNPRVHPEEASKQYEDLREYSQYDTTSPEIERIHPEEASKEYDDLDKYPAQGYEEPTESSRTHPEELTKEYEDLDKYAPQDFEPPSQAYPVHPEDATKEYEDLGKYEPKKFDSVGNGYPMHPEEATKAYPDLHLYQGIAHNRPFGKITDLPNPFAVRPKPYQAKSPSQEPTTVASAKHWEPECPSQDDVDPLDTLTAQEIRARVLRRAGKSYSKDNHVVSSAHGSNVDSVEEPTAQASNGAGRKWTGNYVRDFPEEFTQSWSAVYSPSGTALYPKDYTESVSKAVEAEDEVQPSSMDESFPGEFSRLEPAMGRLSQKKRMSDEEKAMLNADPYSMSPQGLQTSYTEECGGRTTWPTLVRHYSAKARPQEDEGESESQSAPDEPVSWKILAYDQTVQAVAMAETTSNVVDLSTPSPPAEVLARLSNPSKFLPYFRGLELQGYEIFSGSGDVLVFRKVRASIADESAMTDLAGDNRKPIRINPVDMMGSPVTGNFASPTGFVNYDTMTEQAGYKPVPPYRSDAYRQANKAGPDSETQSSEGRSKKRSFGRKLALTSVWVAGGAYAVSVMAEYFSTGGADGRGTRRL